MGLLTSSKSTSNVNYNTSSNTVNQDNRQAAGDNSLVVQLDGGASFSTTSTTNVTTVDARAYDLSDHSRTYIQSVDGATLSAAGDALRAAGSTVSGVLPFLSSATKQAFDAAAEQSRIMADSYNTFATTTRGVFDDANARAAAAESAAYAFSRNTLDNTLNYGRDQLTAAQSQSDTALAAIRQTSSSLLDFINLNLKDPSERAFSQTVPWLVGGAVIIAVFAFGARK